MTEAFDFGNPTDPDNADGVQVYVFGCEWESTTAGTVTGGRWRRPTNAPSGNCYMLLYLKSDMSLLASKVFTLPTAGDNDVLFDTPVAVSAGTRYVSAVLANRYAFTLGGWPFSSGPGAIMTAPSGVNGRLVTTTADTPAYPANVHGSAANFFIGPLGEFTITASLSGSTTPSGTLTRTMSRSLAGTSTPTGATLRSISRALSGSVAAAGAIARQLARTLSGSVSPAGAFLKLVSRLLGGTITPQGEVDAVKNFTLNAEWHIGTPQPKWRTRPAASKWTVGRPRVGD